VVGHRLGGPAGRGLTLPAVPPARRPWPCTAS